MKDFKVGDKVVVVEKYQGLPEGSIWVVKSFSDIGTVSLVGGTGFWNTSRFELVKENPLDSFNLKVDPWKIRTGTPESSKLAQEFLFAQGIYWYNETSAQLHLFANEYYLTNVVDGESTPQKGIYYCRESYRFDFTEATEIKLEFETVVKSVTLIPSKLPQLPKKTESEIQLEELLSEIAALNAKADVIKNSMESK